MNRDLGGRGFWFGVAALILFKLALTADVSIQINFAPADDTHYIMRALHLLLGQGFGPYDSIILSKYPGISLWVAAMRALGIPFLVSVQAVYFAAGIYLATALLRCGVARWVVLACMTLYALNPVTLGFEWIRVIREPLSTGLLVAMVAALMHMLLHRRDGRYPWAHLAVFTVSFAFSLYLREEDRLLWGFLALAIVVLAWQRMAVPARGWRRLGFILAVALVPTIVAKAYEYGLRAFVERHYGLPILLELAEGEYPAMLAAIRSVRSQKDNRMVMLYQETIRKLSDEVPSFRPIAERLPKPGLRTFSCLLHGVCSEWSNGWMPFWVKDEAFRAGLTPTLPAAQAYFRQVRVEIEQACARGRLHCEEKGKGLVPPMELRWTRAWLAETWRLVRWTVVLDMSPVIEPPVVYDVPLEVGRVYQAMTMTYYDSQLQAGFGVPPATRQYVNPIAGWRQAIVTPYRLLGAFLVVAFFAVLLLEWWFGRDWRSSPLALVALVFATYAAVRLAALGYVAVYMGLFSSRMVMSTYTVLVVVAPALVASAVWAWSSGRAPQAVRAAA
jgi:hypothetical protein